MLDIKNNLVLNISTNRFADKLYEYLIKLSEKNIYPSVNDLRRKFIFKTKAQIYSTLKSLQQKGKVSNFRTLESGNYDFGWYIK